ncbi:porin [Methylocapsa polymorpha]|uniref:Porin n=1 Tax=Methylocapsa polymorpha TaxID=3080828 RepID=A0ABZ0HUJ0_9HYPH|nr:porin [Methylocapsa sp. RX1]
MHKPECNIIQDSPRKLRYGDSIGGLLSEAAAVRSLDNLSQERSIDPCDITRSDTYNVDYACDAAHAAKDDRTKTREALSLFFRVWSNKIGALPVGVIVLSLACVCPSYADTTDQLLEQLRAKGILTRAEYKKLASRHAAEVEQRAAQAAKPPAKTEKVVVINPDDRYLTRLDKGIGARIGQVDVGLSGELVFFGAEQFKQHGTGVVAGGLGGGSAVNNSMAIRSGLLPSALALNLSTNQMGYDIGVTFGLFTGGNNVHVGLLNGNSGGAAVALGTPGVDVRQVFGTIGTPTLGTLKIGRDIGLFGQDAILNDFTIFGAGTIAGNASPSNTSLGRIGFGYVYADWIPQVTYTTPDFYGLTASIGAFTPYQEYDNAGYFNSVTPYSGTLTAHDQPGIQGHLKYVGNIAPDIKLTAWTDGLTQQHRAEEGDAVFLTPGTNVRALAVDGGARLDWGPVTLVGYGYYGVGLGTTALYFDGASIDGEKRKSSGFYAQGSYTFFERLTIGGSYGVSYLKGNAIDYSPYYGDATLVASNASTIAFARYKFTDWVSFQGEWIHSLSRNLAGDGVSTDAVVLGTTFFF